MKRFFMTAFVCLMVPAICVRAGQLSKPVASQGDTLVFSTIGKLATKVTITTHEVQIGKPSDGRPDVILSNCTYSKYPCSVVDRLQIVVNGNPLFVPRSAFADLADLNNAEIEGSKNGWVLRLGGGDASETYIVRIEFDGAQVTRRTVSSGTLPNKPMQETIYHRVVEGE
jgi:hypothetical protein